MVIVFWYEGALQGFGTLCFYVGTKYLAVPIIETMVCPLFPV